MQINQWPLRERPRERFFELGPEALSDAELVAIALRTGVKGHSVVELARTLLAQTGGLVGLLELSCEEFCQLPGLGPNKYLQLQVGHAIWTRYCQQRMLTAEETEETPDDHSKWHRLAISELGDEDKEVFACICIDARGQMIRFIRLFSGTLTRAQIYIREILKQILKYNTASVVFVHNHPGGKATPSQADRLVTRELIVALGYADVWVVDHFVVGQSQVRSVMHEEDGQKAKALST